MRVKAIRISKWCSLCSICSAFEAFVLFYHLKAHSTKQKFMLFGAIKD